MCLKRACFGICNWLIEQGTLLLKRACFALWHIRRNLRSVSIRHLDRTNRNTLCPDVITRCTLRMCSEYELLSKLTVCTERKLFSLRMVIDSKNRNVLTLLHCNSVSAFQFSEGQLFRPWLREKLSRRQQNLKI